jgi:hypothetical protein
MLLLLVQELFRQLGCNFEAQPQLGCHLPQAVHQVSARLGSGGRSDNSGSTNSSSLLYSSSHRPEATVSLRV